MTERTLVPSYQQADKFADDEEYERNEDGTIEEEVVYVTLDMGQIEPTLIPSTSSYRLIVSFLPKHEVPLIRQQYMTGS